MLLTAPSAAACTRRGSIWRSEQPSARQFVTPYAATGLDEYFAEALRAWVEANDPASAWPAVSRERSERLDPAMHGIIKGIFDGFV